MDKIGIFVEGQTERIFIVKFLSEFFGGEQYFSRCEIKENGCGTRLLTERKFPDAKYYFLIFDTSGDGNVVPALIERAPNMFNNQGYSYVLALQDLYNRPRNKKNLILNQFDSLTSHFPFQNKIKLILAIMEIESWFLADYNLFIRINDWLR